MQFVFAIFYYMETLIFLLTGILLVSLCRVLHHLSADFFHLETGSSVLCGVMFLAFLAALMVPQFKRKQQEDLPQLNQICCFLPALSCFTLFELTFDLPALAVWGNGLILLV